MADSSGPRTGGRAFPSHIVGDGYHLGLTRRDWFAGMALQDLARQVPLQSSAPTIAERAFELADAMIAEADKVFATVMARYPDR